jgi:ribose transport system substrate-binding protein
MRVVQPLAEDPDFPVVADAANEPRTQAIFALEEAIAAIKGEKTGKCEGAPPTRLLEPVVVTKGNAKDFVDPDSPFAYGESGQR